MELAGAPGAQGYMRGEEGEGGSYICPRIAGHGILRLARGPAESHPGQ